MEGTDSAKKRRPTLLPNGIKKAEPEREVALASIANRREA